MIVAPRGGIQILIGQRSTDAAPLALSGESELGVPPLPHFEPGIDFRYGATLLGNRVAE